MSNVVVPPQQQTVATISRAPRWLWIILAVFCLLIIIVGIIIVYSPEGNNKKQKSETKSEVSPSQPYVETHYLTKGKTKRVYVKKGYTAKYDGGGKKYYIQSEGCKRELIGGGLPCVDQEKASYFDLTFYQEEVEVTCYFYVKGK